MKTVLYFAYGSNLSPRQMRERCPGAVAGPRATLPNHRLTFGGYSRVWRGGVATVVRDRRAQVHGILYSVTRADLERLDLLEGHPTNYRRVLRELVDERGLRRRAHVYLLPEPTDTTLPSMRYYDTIRRAYQQLGFDRAALAGARDTLADALLASLAETRR